MSAISLQRQRTSTKPNIYDLHINILTWILNELHKGLLLNNNPRKPMTAHLLYFRCSGGHITSCNTPKHQLFFCKECNAIIPKKECDRLTDNTSQFEERKRKNSKKFRYGDKILYQFPESSRRYYPRKNKDEIE